MSDIRVIVEEDGKTAVFKGDFAVIGTVRSDGDEKVLSVATLGSATAYAAAMLGCQVSAKFVETFDTMERVSSRDEVR